LNPIAKSYVRHYANLTQMPKERKLYIADLSALNRNENGFIFVLVVFRSGLGDCFGFTLNVTDRILM